MVKKTIKYNAERLLKESEKRVLNEHELIFLLGKILLDEAWWNPRTWFKDKKYVYTGKDGNVYSATKYWEPNKIGHSGGFKYKDNTNLVSQYFGGELQQDPQRCIRILNTPNHRITKQLSPAERKKLLIYFRDKANGLNYSSVQTNDPKTVSVNNSKITQRFKITTNPRTGNQWWEPIKQRTHYINNPDVNDDNDPRFNGKLNLNLGAMSESTILSESNANVMQGDELVNFIIQNNLKPGDLLSGNNLKLHNKKILATVNAYRQTKNLPPLSQDGVEIDPRDNDTYRRDMEREKTAQRDAYNNAARMRNAISTLGSGLDNNDVDYSSNDTTTGRVGRFFRGLGNLVTKGKWNTGDNATFKAVNGGSRSQEDINFDVNAIRGYMQDFGIPGQGPTGQITDAQVYDFIQNMNKPVLKLASGNVINMLQLRSYVATGKMDKRTYDNIIHQYRTQNANAQGKETPVSLEADKMMHYVQVFDRTTHTKRLVPETDRNGNVIWYDKNDPRLNPYDKAHQKAEYRGAFSNLDSTWQNDLYNWTQNSGIPSSNNTGTNVGNRGNIGEFSKLMKQYEDLQIQLQQDPQNTRLKTSMDDVIHEFDALAKRMSTKNGQVDKRLYNAIKSKFDTMVKGNTVYDVRSNNPYLQKLQARSKELEQKLAQARRSLTHSKAVARSTPSNQAQQMVAKNQADYDQILNEKNKVSSEITRITSTRTNQSYTPTRSVIGGYSEGFTPELAGFVFLESFIREFKLANVILREGEEQTTQLDPSNPIEYAFIKADQRKAQDSDDSTEMQNPSETNPLAQDTQQSQAQAAGSKFGTALTNLYQGAGSALSQFQVDRKLLNIRRRNTELDNRCLSYVHNPFQPIPKEDEQWLTSSEKAKIYKLRRGHSEYEHLWNQPEAEEPNITSDQSAMNQNMVAAPNQTNVDQTSDTSSIDSRWSVPGKNFDQNDIRTWAYYDDMGELHFTSKANEFMKKRWKDTDERNHFKQQIQNQLQKDYDSKHKKTSGFSKRQFDKTKLFTFKKNDFNQLFATLESDPKTQGKFSIDTQTGQLITKPTDGSRPVVVADPRDKTVSNIELKYAISNPSHANAEGDIPILVLNKKQGKPTSKDLTKYSESISDILTYSEFKKQFKESIQKQSNEISSKNMYQLYLLGKLKNLL